MNPLHYKRLVTKRRLHTAFLLFFLFFFTNITCFFIFLRQDRFISLKECVVLYIIQDIPYFLIILFAYSCTIPMIINCIIITIKLRKMKDVAVGSKTGKRENENKLTQASWMTLKLFLLFVVPCTFLGVLANFLQQPYPIFYDILLDISYLLLFMNNVVNPFVYYIFLKDFNEGYRTILCCNSRNTDIRSGLSMTLPQSVQTISSFTSI